MRAYIQLMRFANCSMAAFAAVVGVFIAARILGHPITLSAEPGIIDAFLVIPVVLLVTGAGNAINDYFDVDIDRVNKPSRPIPSGRISATNALYFSIFLFVIAALIAFFINIICGVIALINSLILIYYAKTLKRTPLVGNLSIGYLTGSTFLFGGAVFGLEGILSLSILFLLATLATTAREIVKDIEDVDGDTLDGARTLPILIGTRRSAYIAASIGIVGMVASPIPYMQSMLDVEYLYVVAVADIFFLVAIHAIIVRNNATRSSKLFKAAMFFALIAFIVGA